MYWADNQASSRPWKYRHKSAAYRPVQSADTRSRQISQRFFNEPNHFSELDGLIFPKVKNLERRAVKTDSAQYALHAIIDERKISEGSAVAIDLNRFSGSDQAGKFVNRKIRPLPWAVHREEAKANHFNAIQVGIVRANVLTCQLAAGIRAEGLY